MSAWGGSWGSEGSASSGPSQSGGGGGGGAYGYLDSRWWPISPPLPAQIVFKDREDGTIWYLSHEVDGTNIRLHTGPPPRHGRETYGSFDDGPYLFRSPNTYLRLFVRDGHLGYETVSMPFNSGLVITRLGMSRANKELYVPPTWAADGHIGWRDL